MHIPPSEDLTPEPEALRDNKACNINVAKLFDPRSYIEKDDAFIHRYRAAVSICATCPVRSLCDVWFAENHLVGIAGGRYHGSLTANIREKLK